MEHSNRKKKSNEVPTYNRLAGIISNNNDDDDDEADHKPLYSFL